MKKGISLISLAIVIIVLVILAGVVVLTVTNSLETSNINTFALEIFNIQTAADEYYYEYNKYPTSGDYELDTTSIPSSSISQFNTETITNDKISFKVVDLDTIGITNNTFGTGEDDDDIYVISEVTGKVYYVSGVDYEGITYYTLVDELYGIMNMDNINSLIPTKDIKIYDVVFSLSEVEYTNVPVIVQVRLPNTAIINEITTTGDKSVSEEETQGAYTIVKINETSTDKTGNYTITVNYTYNGATKIAEYAVTNFDNTSPILTVNETREGQIRTINVQTEDLDSGIKTVKYAEAKIADVTYFQNYGKILNGSKLKLNAETEYTLYVEDKAGNYNITKAAEYAIYSATDNSLTFTLTGQQIVKGGTYNGKEITEVYTGYNNTTYTSETQTPWYNYRTSIESVTVENEIQPISTAYWFYGFNNCSNLNLEKLDTSNNTNMKYMFGYTGNSTSVTQFTITGMDNWDTSKVTDMQSMFENLAGEIKGEKVFTLGDLSKWDTSKVTDMSRMFYATAYQADWLLDLSGWSVELVTSYEDFNTSVKSKVIAPNFK